MMGVLATAKAATLRVVQNSQCAGGVDAFDFAPYGEDGDPGLIRTADKQFRKLLLYPSELRGPV